MFQEVSGYLVLLLSRYQLLSWTHAFVSIPSPNSTTIILRNNDKNKKRKPMRIKTMGRMRAVNGWDTSTVFRIWNIATVGKPSWQSRGKLRSSDLAKEENEEMVSNLPTGTQEGLGIQQGSRESSVKYLWLVESPQSNYCGFRPI